MHFAAEVQKPAKFISCKFLGFRAKYSLFEFWGPPWARREANPTWALASSLRASSRGGHDESLLQPIGPQYDPVIWSPDMSILFRYCPSEHNYHGSRPTLRTVVAIALLTVSPHAVLLRPFWFAGCVDSSSHSPKTQASLLYAHRLMSDVLTHEGPSIYLIPSRILWARTRGPCCKGLNVVVPYSRYVFIVSYTSKYRSKSCK